MNSSKSTLNPSDVFPRELSSRDKEQALTSLKRGARLLKLGRYGRPQFFQFQLSSDESKLTYFSNEKQSSISMDAISYIQRGQRTPTFQRYLHPEKESQSFSIILHGEKTVDIVCRDSSEAVMWSMGLRDILSRHRSQHFALSPTYGLTRTPSLSPTLRSAPSPTYASLNTSLAINGSFDSIDNWEEELSIQAGSHAPYEAEVQFKLLWEAMQDELLGWSAGDRSHLRMAARGKESNVATSSHGSMSAMDQSVPHTVGPHPLSASSAMAATSTTGSTSMEAAGPEEEGVAMGDLFMWGQVVGSSGGDVCLPRVVATSASLDVVQAGSGASHVAIVTRQGEVFCWGQGQAGSLGQGAEVDMDRPQLVDVLSGTHATQVACGSHHTCAVVHTGEMYSWGDARCETGAAGHGMRPCKWLPDRVQPFGQSVPVSQVACGAWHTAIVSQAGRLFTCGDGTSGALGLGDYRSVSTPALVEALQEVRVVRVACGLWHTAAIVEHTDSALCLFTWGDGAHGCLGHSHRGPAGAGQRCPTPVQVTAMAEHSVVEAACGSSLTVVATKSGRVFAMGASQYGQLGGTAPLSPSCSTIVSVEGHLQGVQVCQLACGRYHVAALTAGGQLFTWGQGAHGKLGLGDMADRDSPQPVLALEGRTVVQVSCGSHFTTAVVRHRSVSEVDLRTCYTCGLHFSFSRPQHSCYNCGLSFCHQCSSTKSYGAAMAPSSLRPYRTCGPCHALLTSQMMGSVSLSADGPSLSSFSLPLPASADQDSVPSRRPFSWVRSTSFDSLRPPQGDSPQQRSFRHRSQSDHHSYSASPRAAAMVSSSTPNASWARVAPPPLFSSWQQKLQQQQGADSVVGSQERGPDGEAVSSRSQRAGSRAMSPRHRHVQGGSPTTTPLTAYTRSLSSPWRIPSLPGNGRPLPEHSTSSLKSNRRMDMESEMVDLRLVNESLSAQLLQMQAQMEALQERCMLVQRELSEVKSESESSDRLLLERQMEIERMFYNERLKSLAAMDLLSSLSKQMFYAEMHMPNGRLREVRLTARELDDETATVLYCGPFMVGELVPSTLVELPPDPRHAAAAAAAAGEQAMARPSSLSGPLPNPPGRAHKEKREGGSARSSMAFLGSLFPMGWKDSFSRSTADRPSSSSTAPPKRTGRWPTVEEEAPPIPESGSPHRGVHRPSADMDSERRQPGWHASSSVPDMWNVRRSPPAAAGGQTSSSEEISPVGADTEQDLRVVSPQKGVFISIASHPSVPGCTELKGVRFSRDWFDERAGQQWWEANKAHVHSLYNIASIRISKAGRGVH